MSVLFFWPTNQLAQFQLEIAADGELRARGKYDAGKEGNPRRQRNRALLTTRLLLLLPRPPLGRRHAAGGVIKRARELSG